MEQEQLHALAETGQKIQWSGAGIALFLGWLDAHAGAVGVLIALIGLIISWYYRHKAHKLLVAKYAKQGINEEDTDEVN